MICLLKGKWASWDFRLRAILFGILSACFLVQGIRFFQRYPLGYNWAETLINYQGGIVRRGLLGEIAFQLDSVISANYLIAIFYVGLYLFVLKYLIFNTRKRLDFSFGLFLMCPLGFLYPLFSIVLFGKKDIIILAAFIFSILLIKNVKSKKKTLLFLAVIYFLAGAIIETAWFFFPLACVAFLFHHEKAISLKKQWLIWCAAGMFLAFCFSLSLILNLRNQQIGFDPWLIKASWVSKDPVLFAESFSGTQGGADLPITFLVKSLRDSIELTFTVVRRASSMAQYGVAFLLSLIPLALFLVCNKLKSVSKLTKWGIAGALGLPLLTFFFLTDWGRCICFFVVHSFIFFAFLTDTKGEGKSVFTFIKSIDKKLQTVNYKPYKRTLFKAFIIVLYSSTWRVFAWPTPDGRVFRPGIVSFEEGTRILDKSKRLLGIGVPENIK